MVQTRRRFLGTAAATLAATTVAGCLGGGSGPGTNDSTATSPAESSPNDTSTPTDPTSTASSETGTDAPTETTNGSGEGNYNHHVIVSNRYDAEQTVEVRVGEPETGDTDEASVYYAESHTVGAKDQKQAFDFSTLEAETGGEREFAVSVTHDGETTSATVRTAACYRGVTFALDPEDGVRVFASPC